MPLRVAAYCRVSTDREDQANSLRSQRDFFTTYIRAHQDWILREVYADEGISGTSTRRREAFNRMIAQAEAGSLDLILTKEVSRFARNTVDTLSYTRKLKSLGVGVIFINDNIDTRDNDGELRLSIMATIAQEESRRTSQRVKWGQQRRMEAGVVFGNNSTYGFDTHDGKLFVKPEEARVVRLIYHKFLNEGKGTHVIARELYEAGIPPPKTATGKWSAVMILRILRSEKHVGDLLQRKHFTPDYLDHKKIPNRGQEQQIMHRDHHEAIIDRETWDAAQRELAARSARQGDKSKYSNRYWCSGKIHCGACGSRFTPRKRKRPNGDLYMAWGCHSRVHYGNWKRDSRGEAVGCNMRMVNDKSLTTIVSFVLGQLELNSDAIVTELLEDIKQLQSVPDGGGDLEGVKTQRASIECKREKALDAFFSGKISNEELRIMRARYERELAAIDRRVQAITDAARMLETQKAGLEDIAGTIRAGLNGSEEVYREVIESVTVFEDYIDMRVKFVPGTFRIWYATSGKREAYTTTIQRWEVV